MFLGHTVLEPKSVCIFSSEKRKIDYDVSNISDEQSTHTHTKCGRRGGTKERNANFEDLDVSRREKRGAQTIFKPQVFCVFKIDSQNTAEDNQSQVIDSVPGNFFLKTI